MSILSPAATAVALDAAALNKKLTQKSEILKKIAALEAVDFVEDEVFRGIARDQIYQQTLLLRNVNLRIATLRRRLGIRAS